MEHLLAKEGVAGSIPVSRSNEKENQKLILFFIFKKWLEFKNFGHFGLLLKKKSVVGIYTFFLLKCPNSSVIMRKNGGFGAVRTDFFSLCPHQLQQVNIKFQTTPIKKILCQHAQSHSPFPYNSIAPCLCYIFQIPL